jgi:DNA-3-methyladenine glycosylase
MPTTSAISPDLRLAFNPESPAWMELPESFYLHKTENVARALIGAWLARHFDGRWHGCQIVETEAYLGIGDAAAHSYRGRMTRRVQPMYLRGGHLYVFFVYGMHYCANVVTRPEGIPEAVLLRAGEGPKGCPAKLLSGPGRLCAAMGITRTDDAADLLAGGDLRIFVPKKAPKPQIEVSARIGVDYAGEARDWPLRFYDKDSASVSSPRKRSKS